MRAETLTTLTFATMKDTSSLEAEELHVKIKPHKG